MKIEERTKCLGSTGTETAEDMHCNTDRRCGWLSFSVKCKKSIDKQNRSER